MIEREINVWTPLLHEEVLRRLEPILNVPASSIRVAFEALKSKLPQAKLLQTLLEHAGAEILPLLPEVAEFPEPETVAESFLEDVPADDLPIYLDEDLAADEDGE